MEDPAIDHQEAWIRSPIRARLRARQLELRRENVKAKVRTGKNEGDQNGMAGYKVKFAEIKIGIICEALN